MSNFTDFFPQGSPIRGEITFPAGLWTFTVPIGVTSISMVGVSGGGAGRAVAQTPTSGYTASGGGGALSWVNNISVTEGETFTVSVGTGGVGSVPENGRDGEETKVTRDAGSVIVCHVSGGIHGTTGTAGVNTPLFAGGAVLVGSGGAGGYGTRGYSGTTDNCSASGGGAGGYSGAGGNGSGSDGSANVLGKNGAGGAGASGGCFVGSTAVGKGGGVALFGEGASGVGGGYTSTLTGGSGYLMSGLTYVNDQILTDSNATGLGGGGSSTVTSINAQNTSCGGNGAVRIIWGEGRAFPSTDCGQS